jgi:ribosome maturation factor RimP
MVTIMKKINDVITELARPVAEAAGVELWDVEYVSEAGQWYLRIYIEHPDGISIDQCEAVSRILDPILDEADPVEESYIFEVASAGAERPLKRPSDFDKFMGEPVLVKLYKAVDGKKEYPGILSGYDNGKVTISIDGNELAFEKSDIALTRLRIEF